MQRTECPTQTQYHSSWTTTTGLISEADCMARSWRCNGGYDNQKNSHLCEETIVGHYSPAGSNQRIACTGKPDDSTWKPTTGLISANECAWDCRKGYTPTGGVCARATLAIAAMGRITAVRL